MMTKEEKQLLLVDLCARLPYEVKGVVYAEVTNGKYDLDGNMIFFDSAFDVTLDAINISTEEIHVVAIGNEDTVEFIEYQQTDAKLYTIEEFKPYLRPMSSMTEKEKLQLIHYAIIGDGHIAGVDFVDWVERKNVPSYTDWLNAHHFDYRGLIPMGLALEAPEDMYKF